MNTVTTYYFFGSKGPVTDLWRDFSGRLAWAIGPPQGVSKGVIIRAQPFISFLGPHPRTAFGSAVVPSGVAPVTWRPRRRHRLRLRRATLAQSLRLGPFCSGIRAAYVSLRFSALLLRSLRA